MKRLLLTALACARIAAADEPPPTPASPDGAPAVIVTPPPTPQEQERARKDAAKPPEPPSPPADSIASFVRGKGFRIQSPDGNWRLRVGLQAATAYQPTFVEENNDTVSNWSKFRVVYARLRVDGNLFRDWLRYWFSFEFNNFPPFLLDGYIEAAPKDYFAVRLGQMYTPISWHEYLGPQELIFPDWAVVADYFWTGRDRGVQAYGETPLVDCYLGFFSGTSIKQTDTIPGHFQLMGRVTVHPLGPLGYGEIPFIVSTNVPLRISFSAQGYWTRITPSSVGFNPTNGLLQTTELGERKQAAVAADFLLEWNRFFLFSEFYARHVDILDLTGASFWQFGAWAEAHYTFFRQVLDFALRFNWIDPDNSLANDQYYSGEAQLGYFPAGQYLGFRLRYAIAHQQDPGPAADPMLLAEIPLPFSPGTANLITAQASVYF